MRPLHWILTCATVCAALQAAGVLAASEPAAPESLRIESVEVEGATRTRRDVLRRYWSLDEGSRTSLDEIGREVAELRGSPLFDEVRYSLHPGSDRGDVQLRLAVRERGPRLRFGAGYRDLSGWYLIPLELSLDNLGGIGEEMRAGAKIGYRTAGAYLSYEEPRFLTRDLSWGFRLYGDGIQRVYFLDGVEYQHGVNRGGFDLHLSRTPPTGWGYRFAYALENVEAKRFAVARADDEIRGLEKGDRLEYDSLPAGVREAVGRADRVARFRAALVRDTRQGASLRTSGFWGEAGTEFSARGRDDSFARVFGDARLYAPLASGLQAALRVQSGAVGEGAPFYDRYYLGGLYTVRGFPSQSLSPPAGDTRIACVSLELRAALYGRRDQPLVAALLFADAGETWSGRGFLWRSAAAGAGYGIRVKLPWIGIAGIDAGIPLTDSPVNESFHVNGTIGWTY